MRISAQNSAPRDNASDPRSSLAGRRLSSQRSSHAIFTLPGSQTGWLPSPLGGGLPTSDAGPTKQGLASATHPGDDVLNLPPVRDQFEIAAAGRKLVRP